MLRDHWGILKRGTTMIKKTIITKLLTNEEVFVIVTKAMDIEKITSVK